MPHHPLNREAESADWVPFCWRQPGIYQLFVGDQTYIGKSRDIHRRLTHNTHKHRNSWGRARVLSLFDHDVSDRDLNNAEAYWINLLRPQLNIRPVPFQ